MSGNNSTSDGDDYHESDVVSEAGTYVIEDDKPVMVSSQIMIDSDESESSTTISENTTPHSSSNSGTKRMSQKEPVKLNQPPEPPKRSLMSRLREEKEQKATSSVAPKLLFPGENSAGPVLRLCRHPQHKRADVPFSRADGGRFSMRSKNLPTGLRNVPNSASGIRGDQLSKFASFASSRPGEFNQKKERPEMIAWRRRKEYDPRKSAAADVNKKAQLKNQDSYVSNRSMSMHGNGNTSDSAFKNWQRNHAFEERNNRSHDDLSRLGEEIEEFGQISFGGSTSSIKKTVDELTGKCNKSIQFLKNQGNLSASVEQLLGRIVDDGSSHQDLALQNDKVITPTEESSQNISNRLERLCSAFDVIQRYLEDQQSNNPLV